MTLLVDTSVWVEHLRRGLPQLESLLLEGRILCHPFVLGELACGNLKNRKQILELLRALPYLDVVADQDVLHFIEARRLYGRGIGWIDAHLLASTLTNNCQLWTLDKSLDRLARYLNVGC